MVTRHYISPGDWIRIGEIDCVVSRVWPAGNALGDCEVVFNPDKPTNHNAYWTGDQWDFVKSGDFGDHADKYARLRAFVEILKAGRGPQRWPF